jgi:hypothetical protein
MAVIHIARSLTYTAIKGESSLTTWQTRFPDVSVPGPYIMPG